MGNSKKDFIDKNGTKLSILVQSNLSDSLVEVDFTSKEGAKERINFAKFCILFFDGDLTHYVDSNKLTKYYLKNHSLK